MAFDAIRSWWLHGGRAEPGEHRQYALDRSYSLWLGQPFSRRSLLERPIGESSLPVPIHRGWGHNPLQIDLFMAGSGGRDGAQVQESLALLDVCWRIEWHSGSWVYTCWAVWCPHLPKELCSMGFIAHPSQINRAEHSPIERDLSLRLRFSA